MWGDVLTFEYCPPCPMYLPFDTANDEDDEDDDVDEDDDG